MRWIDIPGRYVQTDLSLPEYEEFVAMATDHGLKVKEAVREAIHAWVQQKGQTFIRGVGEQVFAHPAFEAWHRFFLETFKPPKRRVLLLHNCTWGKPYHEAWIFRELEKVVLKVLGAAQVHFVVVSSSGVIPREYWDHWPFCSYDSDPWLFTPSDREAFVRINSQRVANYLRRHSDSYRGILAIFPLGDCARQSIEVGIRISGCGLQAYFAPNVYPDESRRYEDYYACLTYLESLKQLEDALLMVRKEVEK